MLEVKSQFFLDFSNTLFKCRYFSDFKVQFCCNMVNLKPSSPTMELNLNPEKVTKVENFLKSDTYRAMVAGTKKFNRKLNEERKTRLPYVDGETRIAQKNNDCIRSMRERMPGQRDGQIYTYPQKRWKKTSYQYLKEFNNPKKNIGFGPEVLSWQQPPPSIVATEAAIRFAHDS